MATKKKKGIRGGIWTEDSGVPVPQSPEGVKGMEEAPEMELKSGGRVSSASKRADGIAERGKTRGTMVAMCGGGYTKRK